MNQSNENESKERKISQTAKIVGYNGTQKLDTKIYFLNGVMI